MLNNFYEICWSYYIGPSWIIFMRLVEAITLGLLDPITRSLILVILQILAIWEIYTKTNKLLRSLKNHCHFVDSEMKLHVQQLHFSVCFFSFFALISWSVVKYSTVLNVLLTWQLNITADHCRDLKSSCFTWSMVIFLSTYQPNS